MSEIDGQLWLETNAEDYWFRWDHEAIERVCDLRIADAKHAKPTVLYWKGLACFMREDKESISYMKLAYQRSEGPSDQVLRAKAARAALIICVIDMAAMCDLGPWLEKSQAESAEAPALGEFDFWSAATVLAQSIVGVVPVLTVTAAESWLFNQLGPFGVVLSPHEKLICAQMMLTRFIPREDYPSVNLLGEQVSKLPDFQSAAPTVRAKWLYNYGFAKYQMNESDPARVAWEESEKLASKHSLASTQFSALMALARLAIDERRKPDAERLLERAKRYGAGGRPAQHMLMEQMLARLRMLQGWPNRAFDHLEDAQKTADNNQLATELPSISTDRVQVLIAIKKVPDAETLLERLVRDTTERDSKIFQCLLLLLRAKIADDRHLDPTRFLQKGLSRARTLRYSMFFRLLPDLASEICLMALRRDIEKAFVVETIRKRSLPAPPDADGSWPWKMWIRMLGGFSVQLNGEALKLTGKLKKQPLKLLKVIASAEELSVTRSFAMDALTEEADEDTENDPDKILETNLGRLRKLIEDSDKSLLPRHSGVVALNAQLVGSDVLLRKRFARQMTLLSAKALDPAGRIIPDLESNCLTFMTKVLELSRGRFLPDEQSGNWVETQRAEFDGDLVTCSIAAASILRTLEAQQTEIELLEAALSLEPRAERLVGRLMEAYHRQRRIGDATRVFERFRTELRHSGGGLSPDSEAKMRLCLLPP